MSKFNPKNFYDLEAEEEGNGSPNNKNESGDKVNNYNLNDSLIDNSSSDQVDQNKFDNMQKFLEDETKEDEKLFSKFLNPDQNQKEDDQIDDFQPISSSMPEPEFTFGINKKEKVIEDIIFVFVIHNFQSYPQFFKIITLVIHQQLIY